MDFIQVPISVTVHTLLLSFRTNVRNLNLNEWIETQQVLRFLPSVEMTSVEETPTVIYFITPLLQHSNTPYEILLDHMTIVSVHKFCDSIQFCFKLCAIDLFCLCIGFARD